MPNQEPDQKIDFSHYFDETKVGSVPSKAMQPVSSAKGLQWLVMKMSFGLIRSNLQANIILSILSVLLLVAAGLVIYAPQVRQQSQVTKPSPLIHPTIK